MKSVVFTVRRAASRVSTAVAVASVAVLAGTEPAFAAGGLDKVNTFIDNIMTVLQGVSISVVTIAIMWAGYKFLFKHADFAEVGKILGGGLAIGGASQLAVYLLGS